MDKNLTIDERRTLKPGDRVWWQSLDGQVLGSVRGVEGDGLVRLDGGSLLLPECRVWRVDEDAKPCKDCTELRAELERVKALLKTAEIDFSTACSNIAAEFRNHDATRAELDTERNNRHAVEELLVKTGEERDQARGELQCAMAEEHARDAEAGKYQAERDEARADVARMEATMEACGQQPTNAVPLLDCGEQNFRLMALLAGTIWLSQGNDHYADRAQEKLARWRKAMEKGEG